MKSYLKFLSRNKWYTAINLLGMSVSLAFILVIGAYAWQETHINKFEGAENIYSLGMRFEDRNQEYSGLHWVVGQRLAEKFPEIEKSIGLAQFGDSYKTPAGEDIYCNMLLTDSAFFSCFPFKIIEGDRDRLFVDNQSAVVTEQFARKFFGNADPIGKRILRGDGSAAFIVTGVVESLEGSMFATSDRKPIDLIAPFENVGKINPSLTDSNCSNASGADVFLVGHEGADLTANAGKYEAFLKEFFWIFQLPEDNIRLLLTPFDELYFAERPSGNFLTGNPKLVKILFLAGLVILLFSLINYVNLTVAQSNFRAKEMATRRLMGSSRSAIIMRMLCESTAIVVVSTVIAVGLAVLAAPFASAILGADIDLAASVNASTVAIVLGIVLLLGLLAGIIPGIIISKARPIDVVRGTFRRKSKMWFSKISIIIQNAVTIIMIACALTFWLQTRHLIKAPMGFDQEGIIILNGLGNLADVMQPEIEKLPEVGMVARSQGTPVDGGNNNTMNYEGSTISLQIMRVEPKWFDIFGIEKLDDRKGDGVFVDNRTLKAFGIGHDGTSIPYGDRSLSIRGHVNDFMIRSITDDQHPVIIEEVPAPLEYSWQLVIKVTGDRDIAWKKICDIYSNIIPNADLASFYPMPYIEQQIAKVYEAEQQMGTIVTIFAAVALIVSALGLMAMSTYFVSLKARETSIRKVFGSTSRQMLWKLIGTYMLYVAIAFAISVPVIHWLMGSWLSGYSYRIPLYWWIYAAAGIICLAVSFLTVFTQSWRAANANPVHALYQNN